MFVIGRVEALLLETTAGSQHDVRFVVEKLDGYAAKRFSGHRSPLVDRIRRPVADEDCGHARSARSALGGATGCPVLLTPSQTSYRRFTCDVGADPLGSNRGLGMCAFVIGSLAGLGLQPGADGATVSTASRPQRPLAADGGA